MVFLYKIIHFCCLYAQEKRYSFRCYSSRFFSLDTTGIALATPMLLRSISYGKIAYIYGAFSLLLLCFTFFGTKNFDFSVCFLTFFIYSYKSNIFGTVTILILQHSSPQLHTSLSAPVPSPPVPASGSQSISVMGLRKPCIRKTGQKHPYSNSESEVP